MLGFFLTTVCGAFINELYSRAALERSKRFELLSRLLDKHEKLVQTLANVAGARAYRLERVLWALELPDDSQVDDHAKKRINKLWDEYYQQVISWNENYRSLLLQVRHFAGTKVSAKFYISEEESKKSDTVTVYGAFVGAHYAVKELKDCMLKSSCQNRAKLYDTAKAAVARIYTRIDDFLLDLYEALDARASSAVPFR